MLAPSSLPFLPGAAAEVEGLWLPGPGRQRVFSVNSLCSSDSGTWTRPGGHGGKGSFSCRWLSGYSSTRRAGSFLRWLYLTLPSQPSSVTFGLSQGERGAVPAQHPEVSSFTKLISDYRALWLSEPLTGGHKPRPVSVTQPETRLLVALATHAGPCRAWVICRSLGTASQAARSEEKKKPLVEIHRARLRRQSDRPSQALQGAETQVLSCPSLLPGF